MLVTFKYNRKSPPRKTPPNGGSHAVDSNNYAAAIRRISQYETQDLASDQNWVLDVTTVNQRLHLLKESYRIIQSFKRRKHKFDLDPTASHSDDSRAMRLNYLSDEEDENSTTDTPAVAPPPAPRRRGRPPKAATLREREREKEREKEKEKLIPQEDKDFVMSSERSESGEPDSAPPSRDSQSQRNSISARNDRIRDDIEHNRVW